MAGDAPSIKGRFAFPAAFAAAAVLYFLIPVAQSMLVWALIVALAIVGVASGVRINKPRSARPWRLLQCALGFNLAGIVLMVVAVDLPGSGHLLFPVANLVRLFGFPAAAGALILMTKLRTGRTSAAAWLDTLIISTGLAMFTWSFLMLPGYWTPYSPGVIQALSVAVPATDAVLCAVVARFVAAGALHWRSAQLLILGTVGQLASDVYFATVAVHPAISASRYGCIGFLCCYAAWAMAASSPDMVELGRAHGGGMHLRAWTTVLAVAAVLGPLSLAVQEWQRALHYVIALTVSSATLVLLIIARLSLAMRERLTLSEQVREQEKEAYFKVLVSNSADVIMIVEPDTTVRYAGSSALRMFYGRDPAGARLEHLFGARQAEALTAAMLGGTLGGSLEAGPARRQFTATALSRPPLWPICLRLVSPDGSEADVEARCDDLRHEQSVAGFVLTLRDVTEQRMLERELRHLAFHDPLTGLANRRRLSSVLDRALAAAHDTGEVLGVVVLDMDDFKLVNDRFGHAVGDEVITAIATRLTGSLCRGNLAARLGGDEFALVVGPAHDAEQLEESARRVARVFDLPFKVSVGELAATASVGLSTTADLPHTQPDGCLDADELLRRADIAHYSVKQSGKSGVRRYGPELARVPRNRQNADIGQAVPELADDDA